MDITQYIEKMRKIQEEVLVYIENECDEEENYENLIKLIIDYNIKSSQHDLKILLNLLSKISNNHHRNKDFFGKIEKIINNFNDEMPKYFSNWELFRIFKGNKRILLFLLEKKIIIIDEDIYKAMTRLQVKKYQYKEYFSPEISIFKGKKSKKLKEDENVFKEKRKNGENDEYLPTIIRNDSIEQFIIYVNKESYSLNNFIESSIYETNLFLIKKEPISLIQYAAFFGSIQIFKYLYKNGVKLEPSIWYFAIHGECEEMLRILERKIDSLEQNLHNFDKHVLHMDSLIEAIKCHHNNIVFFIQETFSLNLDIINIGRDSIILKNYNFLFFPKVMEMEYIFFYACKYDYFDIVRFILNSKKNSINVSFIHNCIFKDYEF